MFCIRGAGFVVDRGNSAEFVISPLLKKYCSRHGVNTQIQIFHLFAGKIILEDPAGYFELSNHFLNYLS